jgi:hypothetical protein
VLHAAAAAAATDVAAGRKLQSTDQLLVASLDFPAPINPELTALFSSSSLQRDTFNATHHESSADAMLNASSDDSMTNLEPIAILPTLNVGKKPASVLPMEIVQTTWEGHDAVDAAACLSGALVTSKNVSLLVSPALEGFQHLQQAVQCLARSLPQIWPDHGSAAVFTSSMCTGSYKLSVRELRAALVGNYARLLQLLGCVHVPAAAAQRMCVALSNIVGMTSQSMNFKGGELGDVVDPFTTMVELAVEVTAVENEKHPELCAGIGGSSFWLRFAGFGGASSLAAASPAHIWVYVAVTESADMCGTTQLTK